MKALVVGGTGFIGMNVVRALVAAGHDVAATRRARSNTLFARKLGAKLVTADLDDEASLVEAMAGRDVVFMTAGHYPRFSIERDEEVQKGVRGAATVFAAAERAGVRRVVLTSSVATVGPPSGGRKLADERDPIDRRAMHSVYYAIKVAIEEQAQRALDRGLDVVTLLPTGVFGELDVKAGTGFVIVALGHRMLPFYVEGKTNVIDADDLGLAHVAAAERGRRGERYIIGGHNLLVSQVLAAAAERLDVPCFSWPLPHRLAGALATFDELRTVAWKSNARPFLNREFVDVVRFGQWVSSEKAKRELGLPEPTPFLRTIDKACSWYERHRYVPRRDE